MCGSLFAPKATKLPVVQNEDQAKAQRNADEKKAKAEQRRLASLAQGRRSLTSSLIGSSGVTRKTLNEQSLF